MNYGKEIYMELVEKLYIATDETERDKLFEKLMWLSEKITEDRKMSAIAKAEVEE